MLASSSMNFNNLTTDGCAAFILSIIFTIASIASFIYFARHKEINTIVSVVITMVLPAITVFCWMYLIFTVREFSLADRLIWAAVSAIVYLLVAVLVSVLVVKYVKPREKKTTEEAQPAQEKAVEEKTEEDLLLIDSKENEDEVLLIDSPAEETQEDVIVVETVDETQEQEETEEVETTEEMTEETVEETSEEETSEEETVEEESEDSETETQNIEGVVFTKASKETFAEQLAKLDEERLALYNEILEYAQSKESTKTKESRSHVMVKVGRMRLIEFKFAREQLVCKFMAGSSELKNYSLAEKAVKIKEKPVTIELENADSVAVAKNMVDIVYKNIIEANADKKADEVIPPVSEEVVENTQPAEDNGDNE